MLDLDAVLLFRVRSDCIYIHYYQVSISPEPKARRTNRVLLSELLKVHSASLAGKMPAYDGSKSLYTAGELPFKSMDFVVRLGRREM
jgi:eukaryotic translation initiation factor 2C